MAERIILRESDSGASLGGARSSEVSEEITLEVLDVDDVDLGDLDADPAVRAHAPSMPLRLHEPFAEPALTGGSADTTWGVEAVGATESPYTGAGVTVAVLDTGIDPNHVAFAGMQLIEKNFTSESSLDANGHGTHCAGTIFGRPVDGTRIGVAPGVNRALIGKVLGTGGGGSAMLIEALQWALAEGANVISMSLGFDFPGLVESLVNGGWPAELAANRAIQDHHANTQLFASFAEFARLTGPFAQASVIVAATGNDSRREVNPDYEIGTAPPAAADGVHAVGALGQGPNGFEIARFSNTNAAIAGPGVGVVSAKSGGGVVSLSGTSMATPHVAGAAALWAHQLLATDGELRGEVIRTRLLGSGRTDQLAASVRPAQVGTGMVGTPTN